jgi:hypothetical protein
VLDAFSGVSSSVSTGAVNTLAASCAWSWHPCSCCEWQVAQLRLRHKCHVVDIVLTLQHCARVAQILVQCMVGNSLVVQAHLNMQLYVAVADVMPHL